MRKTISLLLFAVLLVPLALALTACEDSGETEELIPPYPVRVGDIEISRRPKAVASLDPAVTEILLDLGYQNRIVGYPSQLEIPPPLPEPEPVSSEETPWWKFWEEESSAPVSDPAPSQTEHIGTALEPDFPAVGEVKPEIIFTGEPFTNAQMDKLREVNIQVVVMPPVKSIEEVKNRYLDIIKIMEGQQEADTVGLVLSDSLQSSLDFISDQAKTAAGGPKSFLLVNTLDPMISTGDTYEGRLLSLIGTNLAAEGTGYVMDPEALAAASPDVIFYASPLTPEDFAASELFQNMPAVAEGRLIEVDISALLLQTRQISESLRKVAGMLYPEVDFTEPEPVAPSESGEDSSHGDMSALTASEPLNPVESVEDPFL